jgi:CheY-like chemotaxis protein
VDDDHETRELMVSALEAAGGRVRAAASAQEAMALSLDDPPEVLVSDIAMPREDGYTLLRQLRDALGDRMPRVCVALSAFAAPVDRQRAISAGFQRHVAKPVDPVALVRLLGELLTKPAGALS